MRGLALNKNLVAAGATFVREATTSASYRLWSIGDRHPAMCACRTGAPRSPSRCGTCRRRSRRRAASEPPGLSIGKVRLADGEETLGVLGEPVLCEGQREITEYGGWRAYVAARAKA
jgi:hypothetical protein